MSKAGALLPQIGEGDIQPGVVLPPGMILEPEDLPQSSSAKSTPRLAPEDVVLPPPGLVLTGESSPPFNPESPRSLVQNNCKDDDARLRNYLTKRGLTKLQINEVFRARRGQKNYQNNAEKALRRYSQPVLAKSKKRALKHRGAAPGVPGAPIANYGCVKILSILMPSKQAVGQQLISNFLAREKEYCSILECLKDDYYLTVSEKADQGKFQITRRQVDEIFRPVVELLMLHSNFYSDLYKESSISRCSFFQVYTKYIRNCKTTVNTMRDYSKDNKLQKCLNQIRQRSRRQKEDMVDLLLKPLDRIIDYKHFFLKLCSIADKAQTAEYEFLLKVSKNVCRAATYIEQYKCAIKNRNEMNKIQKFLGEQCNVFGANRSIIRQGKMYSQSKGWASRNKRYLFFLFTDILLWTTKKW